MSEAVGRMIDDWSAARQEIRRIEELEHPPVTDKFGRVWTWRDKDLYTHCGMAWPRTFLDNTEGYGLPTASALSNPNYSLCGICKGE